MTPFSTIVRAEGSKGNLRITIPAAIVAQLRATGFTPPDWVRLSIAGFAPIFVIARYPLSRPSVTCTLPSWAFPALGPGSAITARVEDTVPYRATASDAPFDWLRFADSQAYLVTADAPTLTLWSRHEEPFTLNRYGGEGLEWLLDLYRTKGSQTDTATGWNLASAAPAMIEAIAVALTTLGISRDRQYVENRLTVGVLHVLKSQPLLRLFKVANTQKIKGRYVSAATLLSV